MNTKQEYRLCIELIKIDNNKWNYGALLKRGFSDKIISCALRSIYYSQWNYVQEYEYKKSMWITMLHNRSLAPKALITRAVRGAMKNYYAPYDKHHWKKLAFDKANFLRVKNW